MDRYADRHRQQTDTQTYGQTCKQTDMQTDTQTRQMDTRTADTQRNKQTGTHTYTQTGYANTNAQTDMMLRQTVLRVSFFCRICANNVCDTWRETQTNQTSSSHHQNSDFKQIFHFDPSEKTD